MKYISLLAWECLRIPKEDLESVAVERNVCFPLGPVVSLTWPRMSIGGMDGLINWSIN